MSASERAKALRNLSNVYTGLKNLLPESTPSEKLKLFFYAQQDAGPLLNQSGYKSDEKMTSLMKRLIEEKEDQEKVLDELINYTLEEAKKLESTGGSRKLSRSKNKQMSSVPKSSAVVVPTSGGEAKPAEAAAVTKMAGGGLILSPLPLSGGKKKGSRKTKRLSKKVLRMFKKGSRGKLMKLMKGGEEAEEVVAMEGESETGAGRKRRGSRKGGKKTARRHSFLY